ncbi:hypothetical protein A3C59_03680 [Candidatus Daviesbacteria bacterium RIFCSPHIGHO2_02_FULL_36_13]|uniref:Prepilin-type N-terminal cleavage/methylation domain-containing protein n=1 Tax=Candidatus Daviesbacteria bacterium RIFCSPHIGHO2_02_FULL_36_13 TaxID=1797768 RepID=A0A1F5JX97_9BACT|nr:MAG: hypothetical protein A3C59_03680 [Candidatus Daviesbacteria bacterium RIFCSPHIGHO2_02_FULL_36_13]
MKKGNGFTLIELLLYIAVASIIVFTTASMLRFTLESRVKNQTIAEVEQEGAQVMALITQTVRNGTLINSPTIGNSAASLSLVVTDGASSPTVFDLSSGAVRIKEGAGATINLTSSRITVSNLNFQNLSMTDTPNIIRVSFTVTYTNSSGRNEYDFAKTFYGSADLRI